MSVEDEPSAPLLGEDKYPHMLVVLALMKKHLMKPRLEKKQSLTSLFQSHLQISVNVLPAVFEQLLTSMRPGY